MASHGRIRPATKHAPITADSGSGWRRATNVDTGTAPAQAQRPAVNDRGRPQSSGAPTEAGGGAHPRPPAGGSSPSATDKRGGSRRAQKESSSTKRTGKRGRSTGARRKESSSHRSTGKRRSSRSKADAQSQKHGDASYSTERESNTTNRAPHAPSSCQNASASTLARKGRALQLLGACGGGQDQFARARLNSCALGCGGGDRL